MTTPMRLPGRLCGAATLAVVLATSVDAGGGRGGGRRGGGGGLPATPNVAYVDTKGDEREIVLFDTYSGESGVLVPDARASQLASAPDGEELAYMDESGEIRIVSTDGSGTDRLVTQTSGAVAGLDWTRKAAANGRSMLVFGESIGVDRLVYAVAPDGSELTLLAEGYEMPRWSSDGNHLVAKVAQDGESPTPIEVLTIGLDADDRLVVITRWPITMVPDNPLIHTHASVDWSNDGRWVVVLAVDFPAFDGDLWRIDPFDPSVVNRLTVGEDWEMYPSFDALDQRIYFLGENINGARDELFSIDVAGGDWVLESGRKQGNVSALRVRRDMP